MAISENKMQIVIDNYFKSECDINTSIRSAFEKGFRIGVKKASPAQPDRSLWFRIGEICVDESKGFISAGRAVEKIRELLREAERRGK